MAAFRRVAALAGKLNLWSAPRGELVGAVHGRRSRTRLAVGMCAAAGGAVAFYFYSNITTGRKRVMMRRHSISDLLSSIPTVEAKEKVRG